MLNPVAHLISRLTTHTVALLLLAGCVTVTPPQWRQDAHARFATALSAGVEEFEPDETDSIRMTLALAERYLYADMPEDADRLFQLACQKSQLLYRNLLISKISQGAAVQVEAATEGQTEIIPLNKSMVSLSAVLQNDKPDEQVFDTAPSTPIDYGPAATSLKSGSSDAKRITSEPEKEKDFREVRQTAISHPKPQRQRPVGRTSRADTVVESGHRLTPALQTLYLTFDDGPSNLTLPIATYLSSQGIAATFFVLGSNLKGHEKAVTAAIRMGHRIGNHTLTHNLVKLKASLGRQNNEISRTADMIAKLGGDGRLVRIPFGAVNRAIATTVAAEGGQIFDWDINSNDSTRRGVHNSRAIITTVLKRLSQSSKRHLIILFHDGHGHEATLAALRELVPVLKQQGYHFGLLARTEKVVSAASEVRQ